MKNFDKWDQEFRAQNLFAFNNNANALLWLKVRAICRNKQIGQFLKFYKLTLNSTKIAEQNIELFNLLQQYNNAKQMLDDFLRNKNNEWYTAIGIDEKQLKEDLYKVRQYEWGGDQNNSLDKHLVSRYVKVISNYNTLESKQNEIAANAWNYVQASWYNNWTSYLIESLFKRHNKVVSAVGEIKSVDFFINDYPIDLKVTFFPSQYMDTKLKGKLGKNLLPWLKSKAKNLNILVDSQCSNNQQLYTLTEKLREQGADNILKQIDDTRKDIINQSQSNPRELIKWLYEHQGEMRFGAENRLFLILVDTTNYNDSWKMKRAFSLIEPKVKQYLDNFSDKSLKQIDFTFKKRQYSSLSDTLFIIR